MKRTILTYLALGSLVLTTACSSDDSINAATEQSMTQLQQAGISNMENDARFAAEAASANMLQLQLSEEAITRGVSPEVKSLAQDMQQVHEQILTELQDLSAKTNLVLPQALGNMHQDVFKEVTTKDGIAFDLAYIRQVKEQHDELLKRYEDMAENGISMDVKQYASRQLPLLKKHVDRAEALENKIE